MMPTTVYLDYNATTPLAPKVQEVMYRCLTESFGNPSSRHGYGRRARQMMDQARAQLARLLRAEEKEILFTGSATESNNLAILGIASASSPGKRHLITSAIEHPSVLAPCRWLESEGWELSIIPVDEFGRVAVEDVVAALRPDTGLISIMHSNNEVGTIQPVKDIAKVTQNLGIPFHVDASQSVGKMPVDVVEWGVDALTVAGHKFYASKGVGALYLRNGLRLQPLIHGASQEQGLRPGTENIAAIAGMGMAAEFVGEELSTATNPLKGLRDSLHAILQSAIPELLLNGHRVERLPNTLNVSFPEVSGRELLARAEDSVAASVGSACHSHGSGGGGVLTALGLSEARIQGAVRFSVGLMTTQEEVEFAAQSLVAAWRELRRCVPA